MRIQNTNQPAQQTKANSPTGTFDFIDAIRGFAILAVISVHVGQTTDNLPYFLSEAARLGNIGVQLFFMASAFTLSLSMSRKRKDELNPSRNYFLRRYFRIAPMYYFGICLYFILRLAKEGGTHLPDGYTFINLITNLTFTHGFSPFTFNYVVPGGWSIAVEFIFYLIFPTLFKVIKNEKHAILFILFTFLLSYVGSYVWDSIYGSQSNVGSFKYYVFTTQYANFGFGILLFFLWKKTEKIKSRLSLSKKTLSILWLTIGILFFALAYYLKFLPFYYLAKPVLFSISFVFFGLGLTNYSWKIFVNQFTIFTGKLSYSLYITHFVFAWYVSPVLMEKLSLSFSSGIINFAINYSFTLGLSVLFALGTNQFIEKPGMEIGKSIIMQLEGKNKVSFVKVIRNTSIFATISVFFNKS